MLCPLKFCIPELEGTSPNIQRGDYDCEKEKCAAYVKIRNTASNSHETFVLDSYSWKCLMMPQSEWQEVKE